MSIASEITRLQTAKAGIKSAIEAKGVTVASSATLDDYPELISSISGGGSGGQFASGTFTGTGSSASVDLNVGFAPDVVIICPGTKLNVAGWRGAGIVIIIKGEYGILGAHSSDTSTGTFYTNTITSEQDEYGASATSTYKPYGTYSNGVFTVTNTSRNDNTYFVNNMTYTWQAYQKPQNS